MDTNELIRQAKEATNLDEGPQTVEQQLERGIILALMAIANELKRMNDQKKIKKREQKSEIVSNFAPYDNFNQNPEGPSRLDDLPPEAIK